LQTVVYGHLVELQNAGSKEATPAWRSREPEKAPS
jgi:hypothetical protein